MTDEQKVYIRGVEGRGIDVIAALEKLGGKTDRVGSMRLSALGNNPYNVFIIGRDGEIAHTDSREEAFDIIKDNYREIKLPEQWEDGDILVRKDNDSIFCVYQKPADNGKGFLCHVYVSKDTCFTGVTVPTEPADNYRKATDAEKSTFYSLIDEHHVRWSAEEKQIVTYRWKPRMLEEYWTVTVTGHVNVLKWEGFSLDNEHLDYGNCFRTKEEAEDAAERVRKALKGE